jgi:hypothetical protein
LIFQLFSGRRGLFGAGGRLLRDQIYFMKRPRNLFHAARLLLTAAAGVVRQTFHRGRDV